MWGDGRLGARSVDGAPAFPHHTTIWSETYEETIAPPNASLKTPFGRLTVPNPFAENAVSAVTQVTWSADKICSVTEPLAQVAAVTVTLVFSSQQPERRGGTAEMLVKTTLVIGPPVATTGAGVIDGVPDRNQDATGAGTSACR